jgi:hypothetical protein
MSVHDNDQATLERVAVLEQQLNELHHVLVQQHQALQQQVPQAPHPVQANPPPRRPKLKEPTVYDGKGDIEIDFVLPMKRSLRERFSSTRRLLDVYHVYEDLRIVSTISTKFYVISRFAHSPSTRDLRVYE